MGENKKWPCLLSLGALCLTSRLDVEANQNEPFLVVLDCCRVYYRAMVSAPQVNVIEHTRPSARLEHDPVLTPDGHVVHYRVACRDCGVMLFLHHDVEYFDYHNGGWICNVCDTQNPIACSMCHVVFPASQLAHSNILVGACCVACLPAWEQQIM